jgi:hypothetical protein
MDVDDDDDDEESASESDASSEEEPLSKGQAAKKGKSKGKAPVKKQPKVMTMNELLKAGRDEKKRAREAKRARKKIERERASKLGRPLTQVCCANVFYLFSYVYSSFSQRRTPSLWRNTILNCGIFGETWTLIRLQPLLNPRKPSSPTISRSLSSPSNVKVCIGCGNKRRQSGVEVSWLYVHSHSYHYTVSIDAPW